MDPALMSRQLREPCCVIVVKGQKVVNKINLDTISYEFVVFVPAFLASFPNKRPSKPQPTPKMAWCLMNLDEGNKACLGITLCVFCILQIFIGLAILGLVLYFHLHLQWKVMLIEDYDSENLYLTVLSLGIILMALHFIGAKMCYDCGYEDTRSRFQNFLWIWVTPIFLLTIVELVVSISCFAHTLTAYLGFQSGLYNTIQLYGTNPEIKTQLDKLQLEDECCGAEGFHDWMLTDWTPSEFNPYIKQPWLRDTIQVNDFFKDVPQETLETLEPHHLLVVPFSCCNREHPEPCYHDYVNQRELQVPIPVPEQQHRRRLRLHARAPTAEEEAAGIYYGEPDPQSRWYAGHVAAGNAGAGVDSFSSGAHAGGYSFLTLTPSQSARANWWTGNHGLFPHGCAYIVMTNYNNYLNMMGYAFLVAFGFELVIFVLVRYLDTSLSNMELLGDLENGISPGWLCEGCGDSVM